MFISQEMCWFANATLCMLELRSRYYFVQNVRLRTLQLTHSTNFCEAITILKWQQLVTPFRMHGNNTDGLHTRETVHPKLSLQHFSKNITKRNKSKQTNKQTNKQNNYSLALPTLRLIAKDQQRQIYGHRTPKRSII